MRAQGWQSIPEERMNTHVTRRMLNTEHLTVAQIRLDKGAVIPLHHHVNEQVTILEAGRLLFHFPAEDVLLEAGQVLPIPSDVPHSLEALEDSLATDVFSPPRQDWIDGDDAYLRK